MANKAKSTWLKLPSCF